MLLHCRKCAHDILAKYRADFALNLERAMKQHDFCGRSLRRLAVLSLTAQLGGAALVATSAPTPDASTETATALLTVAEISIATISRTAAAGACSSALSAAHRKLSATVEWAAALQAVSSLNTLLRPCTRGAESGRAVSAVTYCGTHPHNRTRQRQISSAMRGQPCTVL